MKFWFYRESEMCYTHNPNSEIEINTLEELIDLLNKEYDRMFDENGAYYNYIGLLIERRDDMHPSKGYTIISGDYYLD